MENAQKISDQKLLQLCALYGRRTLLWRRKFIGLLPEVQRRQLYEQSGCQSIFEFAAKHAGISEEQVRRALNLEKSFADKPIFKTLLLEGSVSINKLARVASIATAENEKEWAQKVKYPPREALETLVRDERHVLSKPLIEAKSVHVHKFEVTGEAAEKLTQLAEQGHDVDELLFQFLKEREERIQTQKGKLAQEAQVTHSHYLAPLCKAHHQIAHSIDQKVQKHWRPIF